MVTQTKLSLVRKIWEMSGKRLIEIKKPSLNINSNITMDLSANTDRFILSSENSFIKSAENFLQRKLNLTEADNIIDTEHSFLSGSWNGTVNLVNDAIRNPNLMTSECKSVLNKLDEMMKLCNKTKADAIFYRGEGYSIRSKYLQQLLELKPGDKLTPNSFIYITTNKEYANHFAYKPVKIIYEFVVAKGNTCASSGENGCALLSRDSIINILDIDKSNPQNIVIKAVITK